MGWATPKGGLFLSGHYFTWIGAKGIMAVLMNPDGRRATAITGQAESHGDKVGSL